MTGKFVVTNRKGHMVMALYEQKSLCELSFDSGKKQGALGDIYVGKVKNVVKEAYFVSQNRLINEVFKELKRNKMQIAIVIDEYGGTAGLVTMEDILEELVGDIFDEYDEIEEEYHKIDENTYLLSGSMTIYDVNKLLDAKIPEGDYDTISGFLQEKLGRIPEDEESPIIDTKTVTYKIEKYEDKRILLVKACKNNIEEKIEEE